MTQSHATDLVAPPSPAASRSVIGWRRQDWLLAALMVAMLFLAYLPVRHAGFIWDDEHHLTENPCIVGPFGLKDIWTSAAANYFPLMLTNLWVQHAIWGLAPLPYHLVNVALHAFAAILLWRVLRRLGIPGAWAGAALWAIHPVQVESVAWISEMKNTQSAVFYLAAAWCFVRWLPDPASQVRPRHAWTWYALAVLCACCAILSKASTVMLPVALGLCWWWTARRWRWRWTAWLLPFTVPALVASGWTIWEQKFHSGALGAEWSQTFPERLIIAGKVVWFYLGKLLWPHPLIFVYPRWTVDATRPLAFGPLVATLLVLALAWATRRRLGRPVFFAFGYFVALLFPVLGFFNVYFFRYSFVGDHFQYLASMGPIVLATAAATVAIRRLPHHGPVVMKGIVAAACVAFGVVTWGATKTYASVETLWRDTFTKNPSCWLAAYNLGTQLAGLGRIAESTDYFRKAIRLKPDYTDAHINLANSLLNTGQAAAAVPEFETALTLDPGNGNAHYNLGLALASLGRLDEAIVHLRTATIAQPGDRDAHFHLGCTLYERGDPTGAAAELAKAVALRPDDADAHYRLGLALFDLGRAAESVRQWERALALQPANLSPAESLAWVLATSPDPALRNGARALTLIATVLRQTRRPTALQLTTLAAAQAETMQFDAAIASARRARDLALADGDRSMVDALDQHLASYQRHQPVRDASQQRK